MAVMLQCTRIGCEAEEMAESWHTRSGSASGEVEINVLLPGGWTTGYPAGGLDEALRCPSHPVEEG